MGSAILPHTSLIGAGHYSYSRLYQVIYPGQSGEPQDSYKSYS
jgi:hypothetical protein